MISTNAQLTKLLSQIEAHSRVAVDTEADSLHSYREKLCLLQISTTEEDFIVDPLSGLELKPLRDSLGKKDVVLHGADFDLRLLRRAMNFVPAQIFDTVIAARLLGIREFSLAALVKKFFNIELTKGSQKANWAQRPLPPRMAEYAINDTHYLLGLANLLETDLNQRGRIEWFRQSCRRALEQSAIDRARDADEAWRIAGAGALRGRAAAILRELWNWREKEAEAVDRPPFHILRNSELLGSAKTFADGATADFKHFSSGRRRRFREAAERGLRLPEEKWPVSRRRVGTRPNAKALERAEELKSLRNRAADQHDLEPAFIAPRGTLEALAADETLGNKLLVPWQCQLLGVAEDSPNGEIL